MKLLLPLGPKHEGNMCILEHEGEIGVEEDMLRGTVTFF